MTLEQLKKTRLSKMLAKLLPIEAANGHCLETLSAFPEGEWFAPNNSSGEQYTICANLFGAGLIASKRIPLWEDGSFRGYKFYFLYNSNLEYNDKD